MSSMPHDPILVVGAGPVGLSMAMALKSMEVPVRIIDRGTKPTELSKALVIWARTLEVLDGTCDAAEEAAIKQRLASARTEVAACASMPPTPAPTGAPSET